jgi:CheY-like chemotaxis protein
MSMDVRESLKARPVVLIIEDVPATQDVIELSLRDLGADCFFSRDGLEGLQRVSLLLPDLVVLDLALPTMRGDEVLRRMREDPRTAAIPVLVVTAHGQSGMAMSVLALGADKFMEKPFLPAELLAAAAELLRRSPRLTNRWAPGRTGGEPR